MIFTPMEQLTRLNCIELALFIQICTTAAGMLPTDLHWSVTPNEVTVGDQVVFSYQVETEVPPFNLTLSVDQNEVDTLSFTTTPVFGMTVHHMTTTGRKKVTLTVMWLGDTTASSSGLTSETHEEAVLTRDVWVYQPITHNHPLFTFPESVVTPPGNVSGLVTLRSEGELPTLVVGEIDWGDSEVITSVDLTQETNPGDSGIATQAVTHIFHHPGEFLITLSLHNPVSRVNLTSTVSVLPKLNLSSISVSQNGVEVDPSLITLSVRLPVIFTFTVGSGTADTYILVIADSSITEDSRRVMYTFTEAGRHRVAGMAEGDTGLSQSIVVEVNLAVPLNADHVTFTAPDKVIVPPGVMTVILNVSDQVELPTNITGNITWGDGMPVKLLDLSEETQPGHVGLVTRNVTYTYALPGTYQVTLYLKNAISDIDITRTVRVLESMTLNSIIVKYQNTEDSPEWSSPEFKSNVPLNITVDGGTGSASHYTLTVDDTTVTETNPFFTWSFTSAGNYNLSVTSTGEAGISPPVTEQVIVSRPILEEHLQLFLPDLIVWPPAHTNITIVVASEEELPTHVKVEVDWGDDMTTTPLDLSEDTPPQARGSVTQEVTHQYSQPGNYVLTLHFHNQVSQVNITRELEVLDHITLETILVRYQNIDDSPSAASNIWKTEAPLNFTAVVATGVVSVFTLYVEGQEIHGNTATLVYTIASAGAYNVSMSASGEAGVSPKVTVSLEFERPIKQHHLGLHLPEFVVWPPGIANITVTVTDMEELPTHVQGFVIWGDGKPDTEVEFIEETSPGSVGSVFQYLTHNFTNPRNYQVTLRLFNSVSGTNLTQTLVVFDELTIGGILVEYENADDAPSWHTNVFKSQVSLNFTALVKTGQADQFILSVDNETLTSPTPSFVYTFPKAGEYQVTMKISGDVGASNDLSTHVKIAKIIQEGNAFLTLPELVVAPPGETNITVSLLEMEELPTNVTGWVYWGDGDISSVLDMSLDTLPGAKGSVDLNVTHSYAQPGEYLITWYLANPVSQVNLTKMLQVMQRLEVGELIITTEGYMPDPPPPDSFFFLGDSVRIEAGSIKGDVDQFILSVSGLSDAVQTDPAFVIEFERESDYRVSLVGEGLAGTSNPISAWVRIRQRISGLQLQASNNESRVGLEIVFTLEAPVMLGACLTLDLGDGRVVGWRGPSDCEGEVSGDEEWQMMPINNIVYMTHEYSTAGLFVPTARLFSIMGEMEKEMNLRVYESLPCDELSVWILNNGTFDDPVNITRASKLRIQSFAEVNCSVPEIDMEINWKVIQINDSSEVDLRSVDTTKGVLFLPIRTLHYGLYRAVVSYNVSMDHSSGTRVWAVLFGESIVHVGKSELMVVMVRGGAPRIRRGNLQMLKLRPGDVSYDPDYPEISLTSYSWSCRLLGEDPPEEGVFSSPPQSRDEYENAVDLGGCWGQGSSWMPLTEPYFTVDVNLFRNIHKIYIFELIARSVDGRIGRATLAVEVVEGNPPTLTSACSPPWFCTQIQGAQLVNPAKLIFESRCEVEIGEEVIGEDGCGKKPLQYTWKISGIPEEGDEVLDPVPLVVDGLTIGMKKRKLALLDDFWKHYSSIYRLFNVEVTAIRPGESAEGLALQRVQINEAPMGGSCIAKVVQDIDEEEEEEEEVAALEMRVSQAVPTLEVISLVDKVLCNCTDWVDPEGFEIAKYTFYGITDKGEKMILKFGPNRVTRVVLPYSNMTLWAGISDPLDAETPFLMATIKPRLPFQEAFDEYKARNELSKAVGARDQTKVDMLLRAEKSLEGHTLPAEADYEAEEEDMEESELKAQEDNQKMLGAVDKFSVTSMDEVIQVNNILKAVADPLPKENQGSAVDALVMLSGAADKEAPLSQQKDFVSGALSTAANLMRGVNKSVKKANATNSTEELNKKMNRLTRVRRSLILADNQSLEEEEEEEDMPYEPDEEDQDANEKVEKMLNVVGASQGALLQSAVIGEEPATIDGGDEVNMAVGFFDASELEGRVVGVGGAVYVFPSYCAILREPETCLTNKSISIGVQMAKWKGQVHGYGGGRDQLSEDSATVQLSLVDSTFTPIPVNDSLQDFIMYIPRAKDTVDEPSLIDPNVSPEFGLSVHNIYVPAPRVGVTVLVRPENDSDVEEWVLAWSSSSINGTPEYMDNLMYLTNLTYHEDTGFYELFLDSDVIGDVTGMYSIGLGRYNITIPVPEEHPCFEDPPNNTVLLSFDSQFDSNYSLSTFTSSCLFFNKELLTWSSDGCKVIGANSSVTVCACNHLTSFGSGFFVTPNTIDFAYVFANAGFAENLTIYLTLIITFALYLIGLVYSRIMDKKDVEKVGATPLADNDPNDRYLYNIMVHTGHYPNSGTKSKVQFLLVGDWNETDVRTINDDKRQLLTRGASDHLILATDRPLGPLQYLRIWHDNSGKGKKASWFFAYMVVRDVQTGEEFQFINNLWLAVEEGDGQIDRLIPVAGEEQLRDYSHVFTKTVEKNLSDDHLWFSIFLRPARSRFTRVQRLSSCMALLYLSMLVNAMFYEQVPDQPGSGGINFGPFSVSPQALGIGFISNFIVFPPSFCIVLFFRKARPRYPKKSRIKDALIKQNPAVYGEKDKEENGSLVSLSGLRSAVAALGDSFSSKGNLSASKGGPPALKSFKDSSSATSKRIIITPASANDKKDGKGTSEEPKPVRKKKFTLPWWFVIVAWILCVICIVVAIFFLWAYGIQFGNEKTTKWLTALISSVFSSVLFTQPVKIYLMAMLLSWILKRPLNEYEDYDDDEEEVDLSNDEVFLHDPPDSGGLRRRTQIQVGAGLSEEQLAEAKRRREQEIAMQELLLEILIYLIFLLIILSISYGSRDPNIFFMRANIENIFASSSSVTCPAFVKATQNHHFWCWAREFLIPNLLNPYLYNGEHRPQDMCGTLVDRISFLLGHAIFRQIRKEPGNPEYHPAVWETSEEDRDFDVGWNNSGIIEDPHYEYKSAIKLHGFPFDGILDTYGGGGYLVELKGPERVAYATLDKLEKEGWVDDYTKAVFAEFAIFNPQVNLFAVAMFIFEYLPGGGIIPKFEFQGLTLLRYHTAGGVYVLISEIGYVLFTFFYTRREYKAIKKQRCQYFKSVWNLLEIWVIALSYTAIVFYLLKTSLTYWTIGKFTETKGKKYIRMQPLTFLDKVIGYVIAFQVFIGTVKLLKLLKFNRRIGMLSATLKHASADILGFAFMFIITVVSFVSVFYLKAHTYVMEFSTFMRAAASSFFLINKKFEDIRSSAPVMGPIFYFIFAFILYWIVFQLLIAIICHSFAQVSHDISAQPNDYEVVEYIISRMSMYISALRPNTVQNVNILPPRPPDIDSQLRHLNISLDRTLAVLDDLTPDKKTNQLS